MTIGEGSLIALFVFVVVIAIMLGIYFIVLLYTKALNSIETKSKK